MTTRSKLLLGVLALVVSFAFGRYSAPSKVVEVTKSTTQESKNTQDDKNKDVHLHKKTKTIVVQNPNGSKTTTTTTDTTSDTTSDDKTNVTDNRSSTLDKEKEITYSQSKVTISALAAENLHSLTSGPTYGGMVTKPILGPITVGAFGFENGMLGMSLGLTF